MLLSVKFVLINPCISLRGAPYTNLEKTLSRLIVQNYKCCHQPPKKGRLKVHLSPHVGFGGLMTNN
jgi:hypothetical protein